MTARISRGTKITYGIQLFVIAVGVIAVGGMAAGGFTWNAALGLGIILLGGLVFGLRAYVELRTQLRLHDEGVECKRPNYTEQFLYAEVESLKIEELVSSKQQRGGLVVSFRFEPERYVEVDLRPYRDQLELVHAMIVALHARNPQAQIIVPEGLPVPDLDKQRVPLEPMLN